MEKCPIVYSMLSTPEAASDVFYDPKDGVLAGLSKGKQLVDCATLQVEVGREAGWWGTNAARLYVQFEWYFHEYRV